MQDGSTPTHLNTHSTCLGPEAVKFIKVQCLIELLAVYLSLFDLCPEGIDPEVVVLVDVLGEVGHVAHHKQL